MRQVSLAATAQPSNTTSRPAAYRRRQHAAGDLVHRRKTVAPMAFAFDECWRSSADPAPGCDGRTRFCAIKNRCFIIVPVGTPAPRRRDASHPQDGVPSKPGFYPLDVGFSSWTPHPLRPPLHPRPSHSVRPSNTGSTRFHQLRRPAGQISMMHHGLVENAAGFPSTVEVQGRHYESDRRLRPAQAGLYTA